MWLLVCMCRNVASALHVQGCSPWATSAGMCYLVYRCKKAFPGLQYRKMFPGLHVQEGVSYLQVQEGVPWVIGAGRHSLGYRCRKAFSGLHV